MSEPGDGGWRGYAADGAADERLTMMAADLRRQPGKRGLKLRRPIISTLAEGPRTAPTWGRGRTVSRPRQCLFESA